MSVINQNLLLTPEGYQISRSVRLRSSASAYFNRTFGAATDRKKMWVAFGIKRGTLGVAQQVMSSYAGDAANYTQVYFDANDKLNFTGDYLNANLFGITTSAVFRDPSAHYLVEIYFDSANSTQADRAQIWINGVRQTVTGTLVPLNAQLHMQGAVTVNIGRAPIASQYADCLLSEFYLADGQTVTVPAKGETDAVTGVWKPKKYAGTYGTNGFYLNFSDPSAATAAAIGKDYSGNGNNWTPNNISVTAGSTYDSMLDTPTPYADGGNGRGNYCTLNPVFKNANTTYGVMATPIDGNLNTVSMGAGTNVYGSVDLFGNKGKWYAECRASSIASQVSIGLLSDDGNLNRGAWINSSSGVLVDNVSKGTGGFASGNTIGIAYDSINNTVQFYVNNSAVGSAYTTSTGAFSNYFFWAYTNSGVSLEWNFGQRPFAYTPPAGFKALNTQNLPDATIKKGGSYFNAVTYTGNGAARSVTGTGFQPDFVWIKNRSSGSFWHQLYDSVRGALKSLFSNDTSSESTYTDTLTAFASDGFTLGTDATFNGGVNKSGDSYVAWQWKESVSAGFDIVTYTGTGVNRTIAHSLGVAPKMIIAKHTNAVDNWIVYHASLGGSPDYLWLNLTSAKGTSSAVWNTAPTSSVFGVGTDNLTNVSGGTYVAYLFAEVAGFSKFGSYTGNGSADGPFVFTGFKPRWVMLKRTDSTSNWYIFDTARDTYNVMKTELLANSSNADADNSRWVDCLANGFKIRNDNVSQINASGGTYIFAAFAENPFKNSLAR